MKRDPLDTLMAVKPSLDDDERWAQAARNGVLTRIIETPRAVAAPSVAVSQGPRRLAWIGAAVAVACASSAGVAVAAGGMPLAFTNVFSYWDTSPVAGNEGIDPADSTRVATVPGPDGLMYSVLVARGENGYRCTTAVLETSASANASGPYDFTDTGSECTNADNTQPFGLSTVSRAPSAWAYVATAGEATTAELTLPSGEILEPILFEGQFYGWYPREYTHPGEMPVLVGFDTDGEVVGRVTL